MSRDFRDESEAQEFINFLLRTRGRTHIRRRVAGLGLPDIDVLLEGSELVGYEVKYFPAKEVAKAYEGIGEALALLLYGLDRVYLVHVFDTQLGGKSEEVASQAAKLIRLLPIGYLYCLGRTEPKVVKEAEMNPFLSDPSIRMARRKLLQALG